MNKDNDLVREIDFSDAIQGKFYAGKGPVDITIHLDTVEPSCTYELFHDEKGEYHFRLKDQDGKIIVTSNSFPTKDDCLYAIQVLKESAFASQTVEV
ncbi:MAG: DUF1508 domain-containing protein [Spirochaetales bacterium]|nr:DUF1508 domain-containing protein [Spirochaetales bacterium]